MAQSSTETPAVCSYEGSGYRTDFWEGRGRDYEDRVERIALRRLLPSTGKRLLEIGAGFGRLTDEFSGYEQVILLDYSRSLLAEAQAHLGTNERFIYVAANIYESPIADGVCDAATMIRVIHHMEDAPAALTQIRMALAPQATFVLEFANKRNLKAMVRHLLRRQDWSPYSEAPVEFVKLNFDFHPRYIRKALEAADFKTNRQLTVSYLRMGFLKRLIPTGLLVKMDSLLQWTGAVATFSPSVFTRNITVGSTPSARLDGSLFKCPSCKNAKLIEQTDYLDCGSCGARWSKEGGIYNFKEPLNT
jgi:ubiquinone/menaquinone biosynthesis C-methylase UbiE